MSLIPFFGQSMHAMEFAQRAYAYVTSQLASVKTESASQISQEWIEENEATNRNLARARVLMGHVCPTTT